VQRLEREKPIHASPLLMDGRKLGPQLLDTGVTVAYSEPSKHWCCKDRYSKLIRRFP
jgi:hypothetical protein